MLFYIYITSYYSKLLTQFPNLNCTAGEWVLEVTFYALGVMGSVPKRDICVIYKLLY